MTDLMRAYQRSSVNGTALLLEVPGRLPARLPGE